MGREISLCKLSILNYNGLYVPQRGSYSIKKRKAKISKENIGGV